MTSFLCMWGVMACFSGRSDLIPRPRPWVRSRKPRPLGDVGPLGHWKGGKVAMLDDQREDARQQFSVPTPCWPWVA